MLTVGVDLAAEPTGTAVAQIEWHGGLAKLTSLVVGATDATIVTAAPGATKIGIDCALGWPLGFMQFLNNHNGSGHQVTEKLGSKDWRRELSFRETDRKVRELTGRWPLSVATDRLGVTALRCAGLVARLADSGADVDRSGAGKIVEVYPGASLRVWQFETTGYRVSADVRARMTREILERAPWFEIEEFSDLMVDSCDAFDAVIAALSTRASAIGGSTAPKEDELPLAKSEGWIHVPTIDLAKLAG